MTIDASGFLSSLTHEAEHLRVRVVRGCEALDAPGLLHGLGQAFGDREV